MASTTKPPPALQIRQRRAFFRAALPLAVGIAIALPPAPHGLAPNAWHYFALFAAVIVGIITEPIPAAALGLVGIVVAATFRLVYASASTVRALGA